MKKQGHLEAMRGLAALVVVCSHFAAAFYPSAILGRAYRSHGSWEKLFTTTPLSLVFASHAAVCLFFVLSGYVLSRPYFGASAKSTDHLLAALVKRPFRLGGLVVFSILVSFVLMRLSAYHNVAVGQASYSVPWFQLFWPPDAAGFWPFVLNVTTAMFDTGATYNPPLWTLQIELYGSFVTFVFLLLFRRSNLRFTAYLLTAVYFRETLYHGFLLGILLADLEQDHPEILGRCSRPIAAWPLLILGLFLASYPVRIAPADLGGTIYARLPLLTELGGGNAMLGSGLIFVSVLLSPGLQRLLSGRLLVFFGRISYAIYAIHFLLLGSFSSWLFLTLRPRFGYGESTVITAVLSLVLLVPLSLWTAKYVDEPVIRAANWLAKRWLASRGGGSPAVQPQSA